MKIKKYIILVTAIFLLGSSTFSVFAQTSGSTAADITFEPGELSLAEMSSFSFGEYKISATSEPYPAIESKVFLNVRDFRGTGEGWKVTVKASAFNSGGKDTLTGASISFINGTAVSSQSMVNGPTINQNIKIECDGVASTGVASAAVDSGLGMWSIEWNGNDKGNTDVVLTIPGGIATATIGKHTTTITWTLTNAP